MHYIKHLSCPPCVISIIPIFHQKTRLHWLLSANENWTKNMTLTRTTQAPTRGEPTQPYSIPTARVGGRIGLIGVSIVLNGVHVGLIGMGVGSARCFFTNQHVGIPNVKCLRLRFRPTRDPNAKWFAFWWNMGISVCILFDTPISGTT